LPNKYFISGEETVGLVERESELILVIGHPHRSTTSDLPPVTNQGVVRKGEFAKMEKG